MEPTAENSPLSRWSVGTVIRGWATHFSHDPRWQWWHIGEDWRGQQDWTYFSLYPGFSSWLELSRFVHTVVLLAEGLAGFMCTRFNNQLSRDGWTRDYTSLIPQQQKRCEVVALPFSEKCTPCCREEIVFHFVPAVHFFFFFFLNKAP